jgi:hypothetical protein
MVMTSNTSIPASCRPLIRSVLSGNIQIFSATAARIYVAKPDPKKWTDNGLVGALVFLRDIDHNGALFLRLVDMDKESMVWEHEIYLEMEFQEEVPNFYTFASEDCMTALHFLDENEAKEFFEIIKKKRQMYYIHSEEPMSKPSARITKDLIGAPQNFKHVSHIGFNQDSGFDMKNIPSEWQEIIERAGITKEQLDNEDTRQFILDFVRDNLENEQEAPSEEPLSDSMEPISESLESLEIAPPPPPPRTAANKPHVVEESISAKEVSQPPPPPPPAPAPKSLAPPPISIPANRSVSPISKLPPPPPVTDDHDVLMNSIRSAGKAVLKPVEQRALKPISPTAFNSSQSGQDGGSASDNVGSSDLMASLLAKALADRNRQVRGASHESEDDDDAW